jgi:D-alanyl-D-alanine carboxypeptidase (penicillin-binding protein 5/6)
MWRHDVNKKIVVSSIGSVLLISTLFIYGSQTLYKNNLREEEEASAFQPTLIPKQNYFDTLALEAQAAYVYDVNSGKVLYQKNADVPLPLASLTKVMTGVVASETGPEGTMVTIDESALSTEGDSGLQEGEQWNLKNLLSFMLISSSNDGASAISRAFPSFVETMNTTAEKLGLNTLSFQNATGLDIEATGNTGGYGSAKDVAKLFEYTLKTHPELLEPTQNTLQEFSSDILQHEAKNTNTIINTIPNLIASKTGYTQQAGGNLGVVFDRGLNEPVIVVVLGSSYDGRFSDIQRLASSTLETYNRSR